MVQVAEILAAIAKQEADRLRTAQKMSVSLMAGDMGSLVFLYEYSRIDTSYSVIDDELLDKLLASLRNSQCLSTYCNGLAGFVVGLHSLHENGFIDDFSASLTSIDNNIETELLAMMNSNHHDFLHGFIGLGFYWLLRLHQGKANAIEQLKKIVGHLNRTCERVNGYVKWPQKESKFVKRYNISISHGYSSTIILLCKMLEIPFFKQYNDIKDLIRGASNYILANRINPNLHGCWFASSSLECEEPHRSRLAWCYGDLGVAIALRQAGITLGDESLVSLSFRVLEYSAKYRRNLRQNYVNDTCICHGAAGIGLIFREMSKKFNSSPMREAADYWRNNVFLNARKINDEIHFPYYDSVDGKTTYPNGILEGDAGVALYLLNETYSSAISRFLLIN